VVNVSWDDAQSYVAWLSKKTGKPYRLLSEAEREYAARAGTTSSFWWGPSISPKQANYDGTIGYGGGERGEFRQRSLAVDAFSANPFGLSQVHGNVNEWVTDCWRGTYQDMPLDGAASTSGDCGRRVLRGRSWYDPPQQLRAAARAAVYPGFRSNKIGFRVARAL
jgi:formylglycine-generating enzyme required for sulfatase activity